MLSIGKLSAASVGYYTDQLTHSVGEDVPVLRGGNGRADYYSDHESPARWMGSGLESAGVDPTSQVTKEAFARLMGHETLEGYSMTRARAAHGSVAAFDHTLSAPKSVSLLYAFGDDGVREAVTEAHRAAVTEAVGFMETRCAQARVGTRYRDEEGRWRVATRNVDSQGWVAAGFDHYTSRANDPQLHTHVVVINRVHTDDGWRALDARRNYAFAKAAGTVYEASLRDELTRQLGVRWGPVVNGIADIEGFSSELLHHFSTRRAEILEAVENYLASHGGVAHRRMLQAFTLETRQPKAHPGGEGSVTREMRDYGVGSDVLAHWRQKASQAPQDPVEVARQVIGAARRGIRPDPSALTETAGGIAEEVTDRQAVFTERDLLAQVAAQFPDGATPTELEGATSHLLRSALDSGSVLALPPVAQPASMALPDGVALTTEELDQVTTVRDIDGQRHRSRALPGEARYTTRVQMEREHRVLAAVHAPSPVAVDPSVVEAAAAKARLVEEQAAAIRRLADLDGRLVAVSGPGGSGKTYTIGVYAQAAEAAGHRVIGVTPTAAAARKLADHLDGHWTGTIALLTHQLDATGERLAAGSVIVCDEASMVSTKDLARLTTLVEECDGKLVLLGDPNQLPSIDSGGLFHRIVADGHGVVSDLAGLNQRQRLDDDRRALSQLRAGETHQVVFDYAQAGRLHLGSDRNDTKAAMVDAWWEDTRTAAIDEVRMLAAHRSDVDVLNRLARTRMHEAGLVAGPTLDIRSDITLQVGDRIVVRENWYSHRDLRNGQTGTITAVDPNAGSVVFCRDDDRLEITLPKRYVETSVDYGYAQTIHTAQGHTYHQAHLYVDATLTAEHGYTGLSRARAETHLWVADGPRSIGDCLTSHPPPGDRIEALARQLTRTSLQPPAADATTVMTLSSDQELIESRDHLAHTLRASPLGRDLSADLVALDVAIADAEAIGARKGHGRHQVTYLEERRQQLDEQITARHAWIEENAALMHRYTAATDELHRRTRARAVLYRHDPPDELLAVIGSRPTAGHDAQTWDAAAEIYARNRIHLGPTADILDPANPHTGPWRDLVHSIDTLAQPAPVLRRTG